ncbi:MAG: class II glutamine amidotransferase [Nanoarchaeota archaeon]|nr:class II glutamine amidotransferase [Nanoarchaeota archaeon]
MCRLFAILSKEKTDAKYWFFDAEIPFKDFSEKIINGGPHNSGWGVGWLDKKWKIFKEGQESVNKYDFNKIREINSNLILIHLRHASSGDNTTKNAHPFLYKNWIFEHNGGVDRKELINHLNTNLKNQLTSETDSEVFFFLIMQILEERGDILTAIKETVRIIKKYPYRALNFILSDGESVYVFRDISPKHMDKKEYYCLNYITTEDEVIISSDPLTHDKWISVNLRELLEINKDLKIRKYIL